MVYWEFSFRSREHGGRWFWGLVEKDMNDDDSDGKVQIFRADHYQRTRGSEHVCYRKLFSLKLTLSMELCKTTIKPGVHEMKTLSQASIN